MSDSTTSTISTTAGAPAVFETETAKFRRKTARGASERMLKAVDLIESRSGRITKIALWASTPHQMSFLFSLIYPAIRLDSVQHVSEAVGMAMIVLAAPILGDLLILNCVETIGGQAIELRSKIKAYIVLVLVGSVSGTVNFLAEGPPVVKGLAVFVVAAIVLGQTLRFIVINFAKVEEIESSIVPGSTPSRGPRIPVTPQERQARKRAGWDTMTRSAQQKWRRDYLKRAAKAAARAEQAAMPVARIEALESVAPTSGIPAQVG